MNSTPVIRTGILAGCLFILVALIVFQVATPAAHAAVVQEEEVAAAEAAEQAARMQTAQQAAADARQEAEEAAANVAEKKDSDEIEANEDDIDSEAVDPEPEISTADMTALVTPRDQQARLLLWDGSIVNGDLEFPEITVQTEFGILKIPVKRIVEFHPGLDSNPDLKEEIEQLVDDLGAGEFDRREAAHRKLVSMGRMLQNMLPTFEDFGSAERKKHLKEINDEVTEVLDDEFEETANHDEPLIHGDRIVTPDFTIVGKILEDEFVIVNRFGQLKISLADIRMAERSFDGPREEIRKNVTVTATAFVQREPVSTKIRVSRGDTIYVRAGGEVDWTNWSTTSGPDGIDSQGKYLSFNSGCLIGRIGNDGELFKIGRETKIDVKSNGVLYLAVAMRDSYASNEGYTWEGEYDVRIRVKPAEKK